MRLNLRNQLLGSFLLIIAAMTGLGIFVLSQMASINESFNKVGTEVLPSLEAMGNFDANIANYRRHQWRHILKSSLDEDVSTEESELPRIQADQERLLQEYAAGLVTNDEDQAALDRFKAVWALYVEQTQPMLELSRAQNTTEAYAVMAGNSDKTYSSMQQTIQEWIVLNDKLADEALQDSQNRYATAQQLILTALIGVGLLAFFLGFRISQSIAQAVQQMVQAATGIAQGDVDQQLSITRGDELGTMADAFREMIAYLKEMAGTADRVAGGDLQVSVTPRSARDTLGNAFVRMTTYLEQMSQVADRIADGDLTVNVTPLSEQDALGISFAQMVGKLRELLSQIQGASDNLASASEQLSAVAEQTGSATQQITQTIQQVAQGTAQQSGAVTRATANGEQMARAANGIARGAQEQANAAQRTSLLMNEMVRVVGQVEEVARSVTSTSNRVSQAAQDGGAAVGQTSEGMQTIQSRTSLAAEKVKEMGVRSAEIGRIVETIDTIADKTDMLALNAAVEAARAGEHGRGFAVVADQVRKLSEDAKAATRDIGQLIQRVQEAVRDVVAAMEATANEVTGGTRIAANATRQLEEIQRIAVESAALSDRINQAVTQMKEKSSGVAAAIESVSAVIEENTASAEELAAGVREVTDAMEGVASVAEENSASAEEVSAAAEEMAAQVEEVVASAQELATLAAELRTTAARFQLEENTGPATSAPVRRRPAPTIGRPAVTGHRHLGVPPSTPAGGNSHTAKAVQIRRQAPGSR
jgi:methyl-accepting chemotaxis protein